MRKGFNQKFAAVALSTPFILFGLAAVVATILNPTIAIALAGLICLGAATAVYTGFNSDFSFNENRPGNFFTLFKTEDNIRGVDYPDGQPVKSDSLMQGRTESTSSDDMERDELYNMLRNMDNLRGVVHPNGQPENRGALIPGRTHSTASQPETSWLRTLFGGDSKDEISDAYKQNDIDKLDEILWGKSGSTP